MLLGTRRERLAGQEAGEEHVTGGRSLRGVVFGDRIGMALPSWALVSLLLVSFVNNFWSVSYDLAMSPRRCLLRGAASGKW